jgi:hypothetical protein
MALPTVDLTRAPLQVPQRDELLRPGPYLVGRLAADGSVRVVVRRGMSWLRACQLLEGLPDDYVMRIEPDHWKRGSQT